jgi:hypothetical protein
LSVRVHAHDLLGVEGAFITLVSEGLRAEGQREILLTLRARAGDDLEARIVDVASFFGFIHRLAGEGKTVDAGGFTQFGPRGILGGSNNGLLYVDAIPLAGIDLPPNPLAAIVVGPDEVAVANAGGTSRLLARMGELHRVFPFPRWNDLQRPRVAEGDEAASSVLFKVERARTSGVSMLAQSGHLRILVAPDARATLRTVFAPSTPAGPFAFLTDPATAANACLVWRPGQTEPSAITPPGSDGSRITGLFLLVTGGVERDEVRLLEDGYSLLLGPASLQSFWHSVEKQQPFSLSSSKGMTCALEWSSDRYENPVDGHTYISARGWSEFRPSEAGVHGRERVILLNGDDDLREAVSSEELATYISSVFGELAGLRVEQRGRQTVYVQCTLDSDHVPSVSTKCQPEGRLSEDLVARIERLPAPTVRRKIAFQLVLELGSAA